MRAATDGLDAMASPLRAFLILTLIITNSFLLIISPSYAQTIPLVLPPTRAPAPASNPALAPAPASAPAPAPAPPPPPYFFAQNCSDGIALQYSVMSVTKSYPYLDIPEQQPYTFKSQVQLINTGAEELKNWELFIGFQHNEILVSADNAVLADGSQLPASVGNGTALMSTTQPDLKTGIETAMDYTKIGVTLTLSGTEFGIKPPRSPLPTNISLRNDGYSCGFPKVISNTMFVCCVRNDSVTTDATSPFLPFEKGDVTILYDVLQVYGANYYAQVTINMDNPLGRLDFWNLMWDWRNNEIITSMKGAQTNIQDLNACLNGPAGLYYQNFDFTQVMSCQRSPLIMDLDQYKSNDSIVGRIPYCCRNGTLLPKSMDPLQSMSIFQLQVFKVPPHVSDRLDVDPPINWRINGSFNPGYVCGQPRRVVPTVFPDDASSQRTKSSIMTWQVSCNMSSPESAPTTCCVSFSAFYNDSVIPCPTCACGCASEPPTCNQTGEALLLPPEVLSDPFLNRTEKTLAWAALKKWPVPPVLPCPDNCGVSVNWHVLSDYANGWSARMTIFNWDTLSFPEWFAAIQLNKTFIGYEQAYSFNGSVDLPGINDTILVRGLKDFNYLIGLNEKGKPGLQQSVLSFTKKGIVEILGPRDLFPSKVFFGGVECALPNLIPTVSSAWHTIVPTNYVGMFLPLFLLAFGLFLF